MIEVTFGKYGLITYSECFGNLHIRHFSVWRRLMAINSLKGIIKGVKYEPCLNPGKLMEYDIARFDVNTVKSYGLVNLGNSGNNLAFSKWVSPKRTRTYPFQRIYDTLGLSTKKVTIIPVIKDEGAAGDNDRINAMTFSWMNLMNVYIVLAWYEDARKVDTKDKITNQILNVESVTEKLLEISQFQSTALHWNTNHFEEDFEQIYLNAVESYKRISEKENVVMHKAQDHLDMLEKFKVNNQFCVNTFKKATLSRSHAAALRETVTVHKLESIGEDEKGIFLITNYQGGEYYLTADGIYWEDNQLIIQESKNTTKNKFPSTSDIKDGLFKLILFANMEQVDITDRTNVPFTARLKLTGNLTGHLFLPNSTNRVSNFCQENRFSSAHRKTITLLNQEADMNDIQIWITSNDE